MYKNLKAKLAKRAEGMTSDEELNTATDGGSKLSPKDLQVSTADIAERSPEIILDGNHAQKDSSIEAVKKPRMKILSVSKVENQLSESTPVHKQEHALDGNKLNPLRVLEYFARVSPQSVAIVNEKRSLTFEQLNIIVRQFAIKFQKQGIEPGDLVVTKLPITLDWISTLALMSIGAITCSKAGRATIDSSFNARFLISDGSLIWQGIDTIIMNDSWLHDAEHLDPNQLSQADFDYETPSRVIFTNGTLNNPKAVGLSLKAINERANHNNRTWLNEKSAMTLMDLSAGLGFFTFYSLFVKGEKIVTTSQFTLDAVRIANSQGVEVFVASPMRVLQLMELMKRTQSSLPNLRKVIISGNIPTLTLLKRVDQTLGVQVLNIYGSTECGDISLLPVNLSTESGDMGWIHPEAQVEIFNVNGDAVAQGSQGRIATRSNSMVHGYFRTAQPNRKVFDQGWFLSGDIGYVSQDGRLVITGQESDLITVGKQRVNSHSIEELVLDYAGVVDCAAFAFTSKANEPSLGVAIVGDRDLNLKLMTDSLTRELGEVAPKTYFVTQSIPRDLNGKVEMTLLLKALNEKMPQKGKDQGESV